MATEEVWPAVEQLAEVWGASELVQTFLDHAAGEVLALGVVDGAGAGEVLGVGGTAGIGIVGAGGQGAQCQGTQGSLKKCSARMARHVRFPPLESSKLAQLLRRLITSPEYWRGDELCHCTERYSRWLGCVAVVSYTFVIACAAFEDVAR